MINKLIKLKRIKEPESNETNETGVAETSEENNEKMFERGRGVLLKQELRTGQFDINVKLLRTCSEPDLFRLSRTQQANNEARKKSITNSSGDIRSDAGGSDDDKDEDDEVINVHRFFKKDVILKSDFINCCHFCLLKAQSSSPTLSKFIPDPNLNILFKIRTQSCKR